MRLIEKLNERVSENVWDAEAYFNLYKKLSATRLMIIVGLLQFYFSISAY